MLDTTDGQFGQQDSIYQQLWCLPQVEDQYLQICTFTVGEHYGALAYVLIQVVSL